jgi:polyphosphate kinase
LSWLQFNDRVLAESRQASNPLLERTKFLAITASNLDEFFMIRISSLGRSISSARTMEQKGRLDRIRTAIFEAVSRFTGKQLEALDLLQQELESSGIRMVRQPFEEDPAFELGKKIFLEQVLPLLPPPERLTVKVHAAALENLQLAVIFERPATVPNTKPGAAGAWWVPIPRSIPLVFQAQRASRISLTADTLASEESETHEEIFFFTLDDLISSHLGRELHLSHAPPGVLRLTRDGDFSVEVEGDPESVPDRIKRGIGRRDRGKPVRLQYAGDLSEGTLGRLAKVLGLSSAQLFPAPSGLLVLHAFWAIVRGAPPWVLKRPGLSSHPHQSLVPRAFQKTGAGLFEKLDREDIILHHPYDSFDSFVTFIREAAADPLVTSLQQTVYRMDALSPIIEALKQAAHSGKRVRVVIELRARFDELNNLRLAEELRRAGVEVAFGFGSLKLHAKIALVTRERDGKIEYYTHLSTGNYNVATSRVYTDLAVLTANPDIGLDARIFFDRVMRGQVPSHFRKLVSAPLQLHRRLMGLIEQETEVARAGRKARIVIKANALVDDVLIGKLYEASRAGVKVELIIRGACSLIPGVKGLSENIRVLSLVDRFLEHSRIYWFEATDALYLSSADAMPRNFFSRLELAFPVLDPHIRKYITELLVPAYLADSGRGRELTGLGTWKKRPQGRWPAILQPWLARFREEQQNSERVPGSQGLPHLRTAREQQPAFRAQRFFQLLAETEYLGTPLE